MARLKMAGALFKLNRAKAGNTRNPRIRKRNWLYLLPHFRENRSPFISYHFFPTHNPLIPPFHILQPFSTLVIINFFWIFPVYTLLIQNPFYKCPWFNGFSTILLPNLPSPWQNKENGMPKGVISTRFNIVEKGESVELWF